MRSTSSLVTSALALAGAAQARSATQVPASTPQPGSVSSVGCFSSSGGMEIASENPEFLSSGPCRQACAKDGYTVMALHQTDCYCGKAYPPEDSLAEDDKCDFPCPGFGAEACGGRTEPGFYSVWNLGVDMNPGHSEGDGSDKEVKSDSVGTSTPSASPKPSTIEPPASPTPTPVPSGTATETPAPPSKTGDGDNGSAGLNFAAVLGTAIFGAAAAVAGAAYL
ncbi:Protein SLG1 [Amphichorda felina]